MGQPSRDRQCHTTCTHSILPSHVDGWGGALRVQSSGLVLGAVMFVLGAVLNTYTSFLLMTDVNRLEEGTAKTFENMAYKLFGSFTEKVLRYSLVVLLFGFVCGNLVALAPVRHTSLTPSAERPLGGLERPKALIPSWQRIHAYRHARVVVSTSPTSPR
jgi:hypothetical protein